MARTFRRHRPLHAQADINVTNLLDLAFVLLIIFMIATPLLNQEQTMPPVTLPVASDQDALAGENKFVTVTVRTDGRYLVDLDGNRPLSAAELGGRLRALAATTSDPVILIRADASVAYQNVVTLMDELKKAGLKRISFVTQTKT